MKGIGWNKIMFKEIKSVHLSFKNSENVDPARFLKSKKIHFHSILVLGVIVGVRGLRDKIRRKKK